MGSVTEGQGAGVSGATVNGLGCSQANVTTALPPPLPFPEDWTPPLVSPSLFRFKHSWEAFIDSLLREWKTLNVVSALLASAILTIFQIPEAADDPITRSAALLSLICALMSLSYGCMYIVRFGTMRSMYRASRWAVEARRTNTVIWWNVWVLLAMPAVWMSWSMLFFLASILSFVWRTGSEDDPSSHAPLSATAVLGPRVTITGVLVLGLVYLAMIVKTLMRYGRGWGVMRAGAGMGMTVGAISVQGEQGTEGGREGSERDIGKDGERRSTRRRGGSVDRHAEARERVKEGIYLGGLR
ncbi:hypothetical protein K443DRAFT_116351 [Laccaria amethystina LaAM-08-1]|uniref:Uncharacterized protein n=1 Tax=Laccaria amethystina LaAM-08-1 TaxID=1095629 RepID=A0A0C9X258_9AGAR|nr:hypothetical protein K443DRAFT_116351 [Laccaria amethystina LaAM-08-1]